MPQGGSFPNIPDTPIGGAELVALKSIPSSQGGVSDWSCSKIISTGASGSFSYVYSAGTPEVTISIGSTGNSLDMIVEPTRVVSASGVLFLCNKCNCDSPMTGTVAYINTGYYSSANTAFSPTIIGGGGLNN